MNLCKAVRRMIPLSQPLCCKRTAIRCRVMWTRERNAAARERSDPMKTMKIGIASYDDFKARTMAIARGELKPGASEPKLWFPSTESLARTLSHKNRALLVTIVETHRE